MRMAIAVNALGLPAVALPLGIGDGLPQAVQVIGPRYREDLCLHAAAAMTTRPALPCTQRFPPSWQLRLGASAGIGAGRVVTKR